MRQGGKSVQQQQGRQRPFQAGESGGEVTDDREKNTLLKQGVGQVI
jgi:hypothetical protein